MNLSLRTLGALFLLGTLTLSCHKKIDPEKTPIEGNSLVLEFATPIKFVMSVKIDGVEVPIRYSGGNRVLHVRNIKPGVHNFNIHSISYVFGPEFQPFEVSADRGAYFYIQARKYRSAVPKERSQVSIRAYRRKLKDEGIEAGEAKPGELYAYFDD
jgi:hypothetical protein